MIRNLLKHKSYIFTFLLLLGMSFSVYAYAANPERNLGFQGQLFDGGTPKNGSVNATFTFYDALTGGSVTGTTITKTITVANGYFGTQFTESDTTGVDFNQQLYIEVTVNGTTLSPRTSVNPTVSSFKTFGTFSYATAPSVGPTGSLYFNTSDDTLYTSNGTSWLAAGGAASSSPWLVNASSTYYLGSVGVGTMNPETDPGETGTASIKMQVNAGSLGVFNVTNGTPRNQLTLSSVGSRYAHFYSDGDPSHNSVSLGGSNSLTGTPASPIMTWQMGSQKVGVGTADPLQIFSVVNNGYTGAFHSADTNNSGILIFTPTGQAQKIITDFNGSVGEQALILGTWTNKNNQLVLSTSGNVGIGTTTPSYKLSVGGDIDLSGSLRMNGASVFTYSAPSNSIILGAGSAVSTYGVSIGTQVGTYNGFAGATKNTLIGSFASAGNGAHDHATVIGYYLNSFRSNSVTLGAAESSGVVAPAVDIVGSLGGSRRQMVSFDTSWIDSTDVTRKARSVFNVYDTSAREFLRADATGSGATVSFMGGNVGIGTTSPSENLQIGDSAENATNRKALLFGAGGYAAPGTFGVNSNGDKIIFYKGVDYDGRFGISGGAEVWMKSISTTANTTAGSISYYTGNGSNPLGLRMNVGPGGAFALGGNISSYANYAGASLVGLANGNIGIGTTSPQTKLQVDGIVSSGFMNTNVAGELRSYQINNSNFLSVKTDTTNTSGGFGSGKSGLFRSNTDFILFYDLAAGDTVLNASFTNSNIRFLSQNTERMRLTSSGNLGIGTSTPLTALEIVGSTTNSSLKIGSFEVQGFGLNNSFFGDNVFYNGAFKARAAGYVSLNTWYSAGFEIRTNPNSYTAGATIADGDFKRSFRINPDGSVALGGSLTGVGAAPLSTLVGAAMSISSTGNVGIGVSNPSNKLDIVTSAVADSGIRIQNTSGSGGTVSAIVDLYNNNNSRGSLFKAGSNYTTYKTISGNDLGFYNNTSGNISILNDNSSGNILFAAGGASVAQMTILNTGNIGIGTTTPGSKLSVAGSIMSTDLLGGLTTLSVDASGNIIRTPSDQSLKTNIETLTSALDKVNQMRGVSYTWLDTARFGTSSEIGFIAQELEPIVPEVVKSGGEYKSVNYQNLVALLVEAIKELSGKVTTIAAWFTGENTLTIKENATLEIDGQICVDGVCASKEQFKKLLQQASNMPVSAPAPIIEPSPTPVDNNEEGEEEENEPTPEPIVESVLETPSPAPESAPISTE